MAIKKIRMRPEGVNNYGDILHPETSANMVLLQNGTSIDKFIPDRDSMEIIEIPTNDSISAVINQLITPGWYIVRIHYTSSFYEDTIFHVFPSGGSAGNQITKQITYSRVSSTIREHSSIDNTWSPVITLSPNAFIKETIITGSTTFVKDVMKPVDLGFKPRFVKMLAIDNYGNGTGNHLEFSAEGTGGGSVIYHGIMDDVVVSGNLVNFLASVLTFTTTGFSLKLKFAGRLSYMAIK